MKRFKEMHPDKREIMILRAVASNISLEGHDDEAQRFLDRADNLEKKLLLRLEKNNDIDD